MAFKSAISLVTSSLLTLSNYLTDDLNSDTRHNLLTKCLEVAELGPSRVPSLEKVKILQAIGKLYEVKKDEKFLNFYEKALAECSEIGRAAVSQEDDKQDEREVILSSLVSLLVREYQRREELDKVRSLISEHGTLEGTHLRDPAFQNGGSL